MTSDPKTIIFRFSKLKREFGPNFKSLQPTEIAHGPWLYIFVLFSIGSNLILKNVFYCYHFACFLSGGTVRQKDALQILGFGMDSKTTVSGIQVFKNNVSSAQVPTLFIILLLPSRHLIALKFYQIGILNFYFSIYGFSSVVDGRMY